MPTCADHDALTPVVKGMARLAKHENAGVQGRPLLERGTQGPVQAVLEVQLALPLNDVGEQVAVEGGLLRQQGRQVQVALGGDQLVEPDHPWRDVGPVACGLEPVLRIGTAVSHSPEDHAASLGVTKPGACGQAGFGQAGNVCAPCLRRACALLIGGG